MSRVSRFSSRDPGPAARIVGFVAHLRENGLRLGVAEADLSLTALAEVNAATPGRVSQGPAGRVHRVQGRGRAV